MARYRFVAVDTEGRAKRGTIEATSETAARERISSRGFQVREVTPDAPEPTGEPLPLDPLPIEPPPIPQQTTAKLPRSSREIPASLSRWPGGNVGNLIHWGVTLLSIVVAVTALGMALRRNSLDAGSGSKPGAGSGLDKYDFSTPRAGLESDLKMGENGDFQALIELNAKVNGKRNKEKLDTLEIRREAEFRGKKVLFITYKKDGITKYDTRAVEKDAGTGFWITSPLSLYEVEKENKELARQMRRWENEGTEDK